MESYLLGKRQPARLTKSDVVPESGGSQKSKQSSFNRKNSCRDPKPGSRLSNQLTGAKKGLRMGSPKFKSSKSYNAGESKLHKPKLGKRKKGALLRYKRPGDRQILTTRQLGEQLTKFLDISKKRVAGPHKKAPSKGVSKSSFISSDFSEGGLSNLEESLSGCQGSVLGSPGSRGSSYGKNLVKKKIKLNHLERVRYLKLNPDKKRKASSKRTEMSQEGGREVGDPQNGKNSLNPKFFPVVHDSSLKFPKKYQSMLNRLAVDDDNKTTDSMLKRAIKKTYANLAKAVKKANKRGKRNQRNVSAGNKSQRLVGDRIGADSKRRSSLRNKSRDRPKDLRI